MSLSKVKRIEKSLTKTKDTQDEMAMVLAPRLNWVEQISPSPIAINAMGQLALLSCHVEDFKLIEPKGGFKHLVTTSYKGSLMKVCNSGHNSFQKAHVNMDAIMQSTNQLPVSMKQAVEILVNGSDVTMEHFLPKTMDSIKTIANQCLEWAEEVKESFIMTQDLISELLEVGMITQGATEEEKRDLILKKESNEEFKKLYKERKDSQTSTVARMKKELEKRTKAYDKALDGMPGTASILTMSIVENLAGVVTDNLNIVTHLTGMTHQQRRKRANAKALEQLSQPVLSQADLDLYGTLGRLQDPIVELIEKMTYEDKQTGIKEKSLDMVMFTNLQTSANCMIGIVYDGASVDTKAKVRPFIKKLEDTLEALKTNWADFDLNAAENMMLDLQNETMQFQTTHKAALGNSSMVSQTPHASSAVTSQTEEPGSRASIRNAQFKVTQATEMLEKSERQMEGANEQLLETNNKLNKVMQDLAKINASEMTVNEILQVLKKALKILGDLKEKWSKLTIFFSEMATLIEVSMNAPMKLFLEHAKSAKNVRGEGLPLDKIMKDLIYSTARQAVSYGYVVNRMSSGYHDISEKYLMEPVATLGKMMTLDKDEDRTLICQLQNDLNDKSMLAQNAIKRYQKEEYDNFKEYMENKMRSIETAFEDITVGMTNDEKKAIEEQVKTGIEVVAQPEVKIDTSDWD